MYKTAETPLISREVGYNLYNEVYKMGETLILNQDSTFILTTCGNIYKGHIQLYPDTLQVLIYSNMARRDSQLYETNLPHDTINFKIKGNELTGQFGIVSRGKYKGAKMISKLKLTVN